MQMSNYKNPHAMSGAGMDNQDALSLAVRLYGHFLHNLVEEGFEGVENAVRIPKRKGVSAWEKGCEQEEFSERCLELISREKLFLTRDGKKCLNDDRVCIVVGETAEERKVTKKLLASVDLFLPAVDQTDWEEVFSGYPVPAEKQISLAYLLEHAQEILDYLIEQDPGTEHTVWIYELYQAAMKNRKLADQIMAGNVAIFVNQVDPPVLKRITEVKKDPDIPECLKDISEAMDRLDFGQEKLALRSVLLSPLFRMVEGDQPGTFEMDRLVHAIGDPPLYLLDDEEEEVEAEEEFLQTRNQIWGLLLACGPDQKIKKLAEEGMNLEIPIELKRIEDERFPKSMWEKTYAGVLCCMMERVRDCGCMERLSAMLEMDELRTFQWLGHLYSVSREYFPMKILMTQAIFPNCAGKCIAAEDAILGYLNDELVQIRDGLGIDTSYPNMESKRLHMRVESALYDWPIRRIDNYEVARQISYGLNRMFASKPLSEQSEEVQEACRRLYGWLETNRTCRARTNYFPEFRSEADCAKLLTVKSVARMNEDANRLRELVETAGVDSADELLDLVVCGKKFKSGHAFGIKSGLGYDFDKDVDYEGDETIQKLSQDEKDRVIGEVRKAGEDYVFEWLVGQFRKKGYKTQIKDHDFCYMATKNNRYMVEIKSGNKSHRDDSYDMDVLCTHMDGGVDTYDENREYKIKVSTSGSQYKKVFRLFDKELCEIARCGEHYHLVKVICNPETMEVESIRDYANPLRYLGERLKNKENGYLWVES